MTRNAICQHKFVIDNRDAGTDGIKGVLRINE